jgi:hypothetical protein
MNNNDNNYITTNTNANNRIDKILEQ